MAYSKNTWANGDVITAEKLNNIEDGVSEALDPGSKNTVFVPFEVTAEGDEQTVTTTAVFADVVDAVEAGKNVIAMVDLNGGLMLYAALAIKAPIENPSVLAFIIIADLSGSDEPASPCLYSIQFTAESATIGSVELAVAT